jgi:hypothetical protein
MRTSSQPSSQAGEQRRTTTDVDGSSTTTRTTATSRLRRTRNEQVSAVDVGSGGPLYDFGVIAERQTASRPGGLEAAQRADGRLARY